MPVSAHNRDKLFLGFVDGMLSSRHLFPLCNTYCDEYLRQGCHSCCKALRSRKYNVRKYNTSKETDTHLSSMIPTGLYRGVQWTKFFFTKAPFVNFSVREFLFLPNWCTSINWYMFNMYCLYAYFAVLSIYLCLVGNGLINVFKQKTYPTSIILWIQALLC